MKLKKSALLVFSLVISTIFLSTSLLHAQKTKTVLFQSGSVEVEENLNLFINSPAPKNEINGYYYRFIQFKEIPTKTQQDNMRSSGLVLMDYIPNNTFMTAIPVSFNRTLLKQLNVHAVFAQTEVQKISKNIIGGFQDWAMTVPGKVDLNIQYQANLPLAIALFEAEKHGQILVSNPENRIISLRTNEFALKTLAAEPWVFYINTIAAPSLPEDTKGRSLHRSNTINSDYATGRHYDGTGVTVAIADDGFVGPHIDFTGRMTNFATGTAQSHGDMTSGICVGAGNLNPVIRGMATGAYLYTFNISAYPQIVNAVSNYTNYGIVIASTSYSQGCNEYTSDTQFGDNLLYNNPQLQFVFSGGNSGSTNCNYGAGTAWGNITGGYKQGKNVIACGNLDELEVLDPSSSRGPSADGRIKPDICANGRNQLSTNENNTYQVGGGTSAASPGVAGVIAQLYHAYKSINSVSNPPAALIKATILNTGEDIGNAGPDFIYGWGRINALRAVRTLEENRYLTDSILQGQNKTHSITVPANTKQVRVMIYWSDVGGSPAASPALVNNLNMTVTDPSSSVWNPWVLDHTPIAANLNALAIRAVDNRNNMEQVTLDNPAAGLYTVTVNGFAIPSVGQRYYLVWEFRSEELTITYPNGGEGFVPGETEVIRWDGQRNLGTYLLEYSTNNGTSWNIISAAVAQNVQQYSWVVPSTVTGRARVRISRNGFTDMSDSSFAIIGVPTGLAVAWGCPDSIRLSWNTVASAAGYTIYKLGSKYMEPIGTSSTNGFTVQGVNSLTDYWFSVCANTVDGNKGRRAYAINKAPGIVNCPLAIDAKLQSVSSPSPGNVFGCTNNAAVPVTVTVENFGQNAISNIPVYYSLNNGPAIMQTIPGTLNPTSTIMFTFPTTLNMSTSGTYTLKTWIAYPGDMNLYNDSSLVTTTVFANSTPPVTQDFESPNFPPVGWTIDNTNGSYTWERRTGIVGATGATTAAAYINNYSYNAPGAEDMLSSYVVGYTSGGSPLLTFDVSYARYSTTYFDGLRVDVSSDCGSTWTPSGYLKSNLVLATAGTVTSVFTPTSASQWRKDTVDLSAWAGMNVMVRFVNINGFGNSLFIDNINFSTVTSSTLNLTCFIEGFHNGSGGMFPALLNAGISINSTEVDTIKVHLHDPLNPNTVVASSSAILNTSGLATVNFPGSIVGNNYYLEVSHRNAVSTWSALPLTFSGITNYNFTSSASQAYGSNMKMIAPGLFAFYSGDLIPKDGTVDILDQSDLDNDLFNFASGYVTSDLSGDGNVDILDQALLDNNIAGFISSSHP
ncbi:MAG: S8 family serine peptidase [Bacteroidetes bacterium]|nr:S8 family serine peptidase [Bacteroidota bacterium]